MAQVDTLGLSSTSDAFHPGSVLVIFCGGQRQNGIGTGGFPIISGFASRGQSNKRAKSTDLQINQCFSVNRYYFYRT